MTAAPRGLAALGAVALVLGFLATTPAGPTDVGGAATGTRSTIGVAGDPTTGAIDPVTGQPTTGAQDGGDGGTDPAEQQSRPGLTCDRNGNGGATDPNGVTASKIKVATTVVLDGPAASLLSNSPKAMQAVVNKVNRKGGVCGRLIELTAVNDGFNAARGETFIRNFIDAKYFALPVVPSAEGLANAINAGHIARAGIPVVGTDGMRIDQYNEQWVWPVATATASTMRIMAKHGFEKLGTRKFAIVYDSTYQFGIEGRDAFKAQVEAMGGEVVKQVPLNSKKSSYSSEVDDFNRACTEKGCDMVALLLLPDAARTWMAAGPKQAAKYTAAAQTLFSEEFARQCVQVAGGRCHGINVWTGYNPPIGPLAAMPGVAEYISDVRSVDPNIDVRNQFVQGSYLGMTLFVKALEAVGPDLTRAALRRQLDRMTLETDLAPVLTWTPGKHHANGKARAFSMVVSGGSFTGWRDELTGFVQDPVLGAAK